MAQIEVTEESLHRAVDEAVFAQAVTLADKVAGFSAVGPQVEAIVDGIEVSVRVSPSGLDARCACPAPYRDGAPCPHAVAAVLTWLRAGPDPAAGLRAGRARRRPGHRGAGRRELPDRRPSRRPGPGHRTPRRPPGRVRPPPAFA